MATEEDLKKAESPSGDPEAASEEDPSDEAGQAAAAEDTAGDAQIQTRVSADASEAEAEADSATTPDGVQVPVQLGYQRYVYAAYMAGGLLVAFLVAKIGHTAWYRLGQWKAQLGEPVDDILYPVAGVIGILVTLYYWRKPGARQYADEVAEELSKVTWPTRKEVTNSTTVVVLTTVFATVFFALMDRFWGFITDKIYTF